jgi:hypothetical protein
MSHSRSDPSIEPPKSCDEFRSWSAAEQSSYYHQALKKIPRHNGYAAGHAFFSELLEKHGPKPVTDILDRYASNMNILNLEPSEEQLARRTDAPMLQSRRAFLTRLGHIGRNVFWAASAATILIDAMDAIAAEPEAKKTEEGEYAYTSTPIRDAFRDATPRLERLQREVGGDNLRDAAEMVALVEAAHQYLRHRDFRNKLLEISLVTEELVEAIQLAPKRSTSQHSSTMADRFWQHFTRTNPGGGLPPFK